MSEQLILDLPVRPALGRDAFLVSPANAQAVAGIENWQNWPHGKMVLIGPEASGKTHLVHVWASLADAEIVTAEEVPTRDPATIGRAVAVDGVDQIRSDADQEALFHLHNAVIGQGGSLLLTGQGVPALWPLTLPDLKSRVMQAGVLKLEAPDDALLSALMVKLAADRQLSLSPRLVSFMVLRMERSFAAARTLIAAIDARSLRDKVPPGQKMIGSLLEEMGR